MKRCENWQKLLISFIGLCILAILFTGSQEPPAIISLSNSTSTNYHYFLISSSYQISNLDLVKQSGSGTFRRAAMTALTVLLSLLAFALSRHIVFDHFFERITVKRLQPIYLLLDTPPPAI